jgi:hypothetical protein
MERNMADVSEEFSELFHYTTVSSFESIYKTKTFWATHYEDLNDSTELERFRLNVCDFIRPIIHGTLSTWMQQLAEIANDVEKRGGIEAVVNKEANTLLDALHENTFGALTFGDTFICSFCAHINDYQANHGLLSQWRGYGADGGVAIVLKTHGIEKLMRSEQEIFGHQVHHLGKVVYDSAEGDVEIKNEFKSLFKSFPNILNGMFPKDRNRNALDLTPHFEDILEPFVFGSTLVKHHAFHEEKEIRIVVSPRLTDEGATFYRSVHDSKPQKQTRYIRNGERERRYIELFNRMPDDVSLPIKRIIIGPSKIQNVNYQIIKDLVDGSNIRVDKSDIPFLG